MPGRLARKAACPHGLIRQSDDLKQGSTFRAAHSPEVKMTLPDAYGRSRLVAVNRHRSSTGRFCCKRDLQVKEQRLPI